MSESKLYTRSEVQKVNSKDSTLIIIHDEVYNVTEFLNEHPGGEEVLLEHGGKDATEDFRDVGHSTDALELMKKYRVGALVESERSNIPPKKGWVAGYDSERPEKYVNGPGVPFYLLIAALSVVVFAYYYLL